MAHYSVVAVTPSTDAWIPDYLASVGPLVEKHGGTYLARTASHSQREGDHTSALWVILQWPSPEAESAFYDDPAYADLRAARLAGSASNWISVEGKDDFA